MTSGKEKRGQSSIELVLAFIGTGILFVGILSTWSWLIAAMVSRQRNFDSSRITAATPDPKDAGDTSTLPPKKFSVWGD